MNGKNAAIPQVIPTRCACVLLVMTVVATACGTAAAGDLEDYQAHRQKQLAPLQGEFDRLCALYAKDKAMPLFRERVALIEKVAVFSIKRLAMNRDQVIEEVLEGAMASSGSKATDGADSLLLDARDLYLQYRDAFAEPLPKPACTAAELATLQKYYETALVAAGDYMISHAGAMAKVHEKVARETAELCLVLQFLQIPDVRWSAKQVEALPPWMRAASMSDIIAAFALRVGRPFTAVQFAMQAKKELADPDAACDYLLAKAKELEPEAEFISAVRTYQAAVELAEKAGKADKATEARFSLAATYERLGHLPLAAETVKQAMAAQPQSSQWGKAALMRLKYLYQGQNFADLLQEYPAIEKDPRCRPYLPQILYIAWVTSRRENRLDKAHELEETFLKDYPKHPLGADIYFASAMTALAAANYEEASRLLETIQDRFPDSRIVPKVKEIQKRLKDMHSSPPK